MAPIPSLLIYLSGKARRHRSPKNTESQILKLRLPPPTRRLRRGHFCPSTYGVRCVGACDLSICIVGPPSSELAATHRNRQREQAVSADDQPRIDSSYRNGPIYHPDPFLLLLHKILETEFGRILFAGVKFFLLYYLLR